MKIQTFVASALLFGTLAQAQPPQARPELSEKPAPLTELFRSDTDNQRFFHLKNSEPSAEPPGISAAPTRAWAALYNSTADSADEAYAIALDGSGNVYVTGYSIGPSGKFDYLTVKYNSAGASQWFARYNGSANGQDGAFDIAVDGSGNVYVTGSSTGSKEGFDYATIKYNSAGVEQWVARYNGPGNWHDGAFDIAVNGAGNVYVTGYSYSSTGYDFATIKYNSAGVQEWVARYDGPSYSEDSAYELAVDGSGNVYVTGYSTGLSKNFDYTTIKYNSAGVSQWVARYNSPADATDAAYDLALDGAGNVYVTGYSIGSKGNFDYVTIKYNNAGVRKWVKRYNGPGNDLDTATDIAVDASGNVYVTGISIGSSGYEDCATIKYNSAGGKQWVRRHQGLKNGDDGARDIVVDGSGNVYVSGYSQRTNGLYDYLTIKYNSAGVKQWAALYNGPGKNNDGAHDLAIDGSGNVYVTGRSIGKNGNTDYATIKYLASGASAAFSEMTPHDSDEQSEVEESATLPANFSLTQNFPNPFNPTTTIGFEMPTAEKARLTIYNLRGELVRTLVDGEIPAGYHHITFDASGLASGIYFYRLEAGVFAVTRKMVVGK
jgi:uncharacterized delta-60 repeat protein